MIFRPKSFICKMFFVSTSSICRGFSYQSPSLRLFQPRLKTTEGSTHTFCAAHVAPGHDRSWLCSQLAAVHHRWTRGAVSWAMGVFIFPVMFQGLGLMSQLLGICETLITKTAISVGNLIFSILGWCETLGHQSQRLYSPNGEPVGATESSQLFPRSNSCVSHELERFCQHFWTIVPGCGSDFSILFVHFQRVVLGNKYGDLGRFGLYFGYSCQTRINKPQTAV